MVCCSLVVRHLALLDCAALAHPSFRAADLVQLRGSVVVAISNLPIFHTYFCYLNYTPSINVSQAAVPVNSSQCFVLCIALYWIKIYTV